MRRRPWSLSVMGAFFLLVCISIPVQIAVRFEHSPVDLYAIWIKISMLSRVIMVMCLVNAWLALSARAALLVTAPLLTALVIWNNYLLYHFDPSVPLVQTLAASVVFLLFSGLVFEPTARLVLQNPEKRWWRVAKRRRVALTAIVNTGDGCFETRTFDVSLTGVFLANPKGDALEEVNQEPPAVIRDDPVEVLLRLPGEREMLLRGEVARQSNRATGGYPAGIGVRLRQTSLAQKKQLSQLVRGV